MFIGHFALGFAAKRVAPQLSLGTGFLAAQFVDLLWPTLLMLGLESVRIAPGATAVTPLVFEHYPISHSLLAVLAWAAVLGLAWRVARGSTRAGVVVALLVLSHWVLDALVHAPDLPIAPGLDARAGLGLWNSVFASQALELALFAAGVWLYASATRARDAAGRWAFVGLVAFLLVVHAANVLGPPPPDTRTLAWVGQAQWLLVAWAYWVDAHRAPAKWIVPRATCRLGSR